MSYERKKLQIFISSPSDVRQERLLASQVIERLAREFAIWIDVEPVLWEREPLIATEHFQTMIVPPSSTDIVICILWSRLGTPLPDDQFIGPITRKRVTGTEWEFEDAVASWRERRSPELLLYRKEAAVTAIISDRNARDEALRQLELLEAFIEHWFLSPYDHSFKAASHTFMGADDFVELLETHLRELLRRRLPQGARSAAITTVRWHRGSPFRGLESFELEHAPVYFGRLKARTQLREVLGRRAAAGVAFVVVMGMSGVGKSSLVKAGLLADLVLPGMIGRVGVVRHATFRPGSQPLMVLASAVLAACPEISLDAASFAILLTEAPQRALDLLRLALATAATTAQLTPTAEARLVLVADQLEELFALEATQDRYQFARALAVLARSGIAWIIGTMRSDQYHHVADIPELAELSAGEGTYLLLAPRLEEMGQIICQPAREAGLSFEMAPDTGVGLDAVLLEAAGRNVGGLPLLEFVLDELWHQREGQTLTYAAYRQLGELVGALAERAEATLSSLEPEVQAEFPAVMQALVSLDGDEEKAPAGRTAAIDGLSALAHAFVEAFVTARLLVSDMVDGSPIVRVAHEALLTNWPRVTAWLDENRVRLRALSRVARAAARWREEAEHPDYLLPDGKPLEEALAVFSELPAGGAEFVNASQAWRTGQRGAVERVQREAALSKREMLAARLTRKAEEVWTPNDRLVLAAEAFRIFPGAGPGKRLRSILARAPRVIGEFTNVEAVAPDASSAIVRDDECTLRRILLPSGVTDGVVDTRQIKVVPMARGVLNRLRVLTVLRSDQRDGFTSPIEWEAVGSMSDDASRAIVKTRYGWRELLVDFIEGSAYELPEYKHRRTISLSPMGLFVLVNDEFDGLEIREAHAGRSLWRAAGESYETAISLDDRLIAISTRDADKSGMLFFHDLQSGTLVRSMQLEATRIKPLGFGSSADRLMVRAESVIPRHYISEPPYTVLLIDVAKGTVLAEHNTPFFVDEVSATQVDQGMLLEHIESPSGLKVVDMVARTTRETIPTYPGRSYTSRVARDGQVVLTFETHEWDRMPRFRSEVICPATGDGRFDFDGSCQLHPQQPIAITRSGVTIQLWQLEQLRTDVVGRGLCKLEAGIRRLAFSRAGVKLAVAYHSNYSLAGLYAPNPFIGWPSPEEQEEMWNRSIKDNELGLLDLENGYERWRVACNGVPSGMCFDSGDRHLAVGTSAGTEIRRVADGSMIAVLVPAISPRALAFNPADQTLAVADDAKIRFYEGDTGAPADWKSVECENVESIAFDGEGTLLAAATGDNWCAWSRHGTRYGGALLSPTVSRLNTGQLVATGYSETGLVVVDIPTGELRLSVDVTGEQDWSAALSSDGSTFAVRDGAVLKIFDCHTLEVRTRFEGVRGSLTFGKDARWLYELHNATARVWDLDTPCLALETEYPTSYYVMPDGKHLMWSAVPDLQWLSFDPDELITLAMTRIASPLDERQWMELMPERPYEPIRPLRRQVEISK